ncbi:hypothetical protein PoB_003035400 [Plakobranchus ocellatus]|uniref:Uncharacterized protein n=1 Tax=Plakobranchus ocellatus TaxID=259542 RepID=A0AAV4ABP2_9GAST|nr:hypothetical protein PoB_003035400 [Plakobranchus ocellatus]
MKQRSAEEANLNILKLLLKQMSALERSQTRIFSRTTSSASSTDEEVTLALTLVTIFNSSDRTFDTIHNDLTCDVGEDG